MVRPYMWALSIAITGVRWICVPIDVSRCRDAPWCVRMRKADLASLPLKNCQNFKGAMRSVHSDIDGATLITRRQGRKIIFGEMKDLRVAKRLPQF